jgi:hypothetical protein
MWSFRNLALGKSVNSDVQMAKTLEYASYIFLIAGQAI